MFPFHRLPPLLVEHGGAKETGRVGNRRRGQTSCVPLLVEILNFGFHFRHEGGERAFSSYKMGEASQ
jgi:hypothetical protein